MTVTVYGFQAIWLWPLLHYIRRLFCGFYTEWLQFHQLLKLPAMTMLSSQLNVLLIICVFKCLWCSFFHVKQLYFLIFCNCCRFLVALYRFLCTEFSHLGMCRKEGNHVTILFNLSLQFFLLHIGLSFGAVLEFAAFCLLGMEMAMVAQEEEVVMVDMRIVHQV